MSIEGKTIVFTGRISKPRHEFEQMVLSGGGNFSSSVSGHTDYVVVGESPGSKLAKATALGIPVITEQDFLNLIAEDMSEGQDRRATSEELALFNSHYEDRVCKWCSDIYSRRIGNPDFETCPVCQTWTYTRCPHCNSESVTYVEDFKYYNCHCGLWFEAPLSDHRTRVKHQCMFVEKGRGDGIIRKACVACNKTVKITYADELYAKQKFLDAPQAVRDHRELKLFEYNVREGERQFQEWFDALPEEHKEGLARQLRGFEEV